ncbi:putative indole-3-pyruvate monooxygenase YUCCA10 [Dichanthelium oligosanthes]|uniref:Flavin-containing monooxygenase n=1 Tax=Dichanthelium oligosanthes TaxID=888268 RepID=A0A1E5UND6_9POAL|nr:putative indole-3-pyruvate monooxygenase YUCCA10 [Dichanthelium oligosanthes]
MEVVVLIVGAGPAGLATAACLSRCSVPYLIVEREDCSASLWRHGTYDRLKLHLAKEFCALPYVPYPDGTPTYVPKEEFIKYLDGYTEHFGIKPRYCTLVESATYDEETSRWVVAARDTVAGTEVRYSARFLVVATGENGVGSIPEIPGLESFPGEAFHSSTYKSGGSYAGKRVLVVGCGNSGMEIACCLASHGADTSIVVRSPVHIMTMELIRFGMTLVKHVPITIVDWIIVNIANVIFGDLSKHGIVRPKTGPLDLKSKTGRSSVIDVGTVGLIKKGIIKVFGGISKIIGNKVEFECGKESSFDAIVFATGYKTTANLWLKDDKGMLNSDGLPEKGYPNHWKGENGLYCAGFARRGLSGISMDANNIANDIVSAGTFLSG